jgi:nitroreductase
MSKNQELASLYQAIFVRKSVRKYKPEPLATDVLDTVLQTANETAAIDPSLPMAFRILEPAQIKGLVSAKAPHYLAVYAPHSAEARINAAFRLQQMDLWFCANGYGSCWLGMPNSKQEVASQDGLPFMILLAFGTPDEDSKRGSVAEFKRKSLESVTSAAEHKELVEAVRLAPSASNRQPWFVTGGADALHLNIKKDGAFGKLLFKEMRFSDAGIALCHLWLAAINANSFANFERDPADPDTPKGYEYVYGIKLHR